MRITLILLLSIVAACASPAPQFFGATRHDIQIEGMRFAVFVKEDEAEIIRLGYLPRSQRARVPELMLRAARQASGCSVPPHSLTSRLPGDPGEARVVLKC